MFNYTSFELGLLILLISFCVYAILGRICQCIETCAQAKCMEKIYGSNPGMTPGDIAKVAKEIQDGKK